MEGFIKLHRRFMEWRWYHDPSMAHLFLHLIMSANYSNTEWKEITVRRGQLVTSRHALAMDTGLSEKVIRRCLHQLERTGEIRIEPTRHYSVITVTKYAEYQGFGAYTGQQKACEGPTVAQQRATLEKEKMKREEEVTHSNFRKTQGNCYDDNIQPFSKNHGTNYSNGYRSAESIVSGAAGIILDLRSGSDETQRELPVV